jgi:hypothetical protein
MVGLTLVILVAAMVALVYRDRIARAGRNAIITFLATCMRIGRAHDRFIDGAVNEAKTRLQEEYAPLREEAVAVAAAQLGVANAVDATMTVSADPNPGVATARGAMRGFLIGAGAFIGWWILVALVFGLAGLLLALIMGGIPFALHFVLGVFYFLIVGIGGVCVVEQKDAIITKLRRQPS